MLEEFKFKGTNTKVHEYYAEEQSYSMGVRWSDMCERLAGETGNKKRSRP